MRHPIDMHYFRSFSVAIFSILLAGQAPTSAEEAAPKWTYSSTSLRPFWQGNTVEGESVLFIRDPTSRMAAAKVLFPIKKIVTVKNSAGDMVYEEGRDYVWKVDSREIVLPESSRIVSKTPAELRRPAKSQPYQLTHRDGNGEIFFGAKLEYAEMQTCITYQHDSFEWKSPLPAMDPAALPRTLTKLQQKQPLSVVLIGDSISAGANASALANSPPFQPAYPELVRLHLESHFQSPVTLKNLAVGGTDTAWGLTQVEKILEGSPDLVIIAFGMNDSAGRASPDYQAKIQEMISRVREKRPEAEFILVASMLGNPAWIRLKQELFTEYREGLKKLCGPGVALADVTSVWGQFLLLKQDWDQTGNGVNHPNDFGHRVYAQIICALLIPASSP